jgi:CheY-like chemotaxis protein
MCAGKQAHGFLGQSPTPDPLMAFRHKGDGAMELSKIPKTQADYGISTILIVETDGALRRSIGELLSENGFHVLEAEDEAGTVRLVRAHSRHIDVLVIGVDIGDSSFSTLMQKHRIGMGLTFIPRHPVLGASVPDIVLANVLALLKTPTGGDSSERPAKR